MGHVKHAVLIAALAVFAAGGAALAQVNLVTFSEGDVIRADEVNQNFDNLASAVESVQGRIDTLEDTLEGDQSRVVRVTPADLVPMRSERDYLRFKGELVLPGSNNVYSCFYTRISLPHGATVTELAATLSDPDGTGTNDAAEAFLSRRAWDAEADDSLAAVPQAAATYSEVSTTGGDLPATVDADAYAYTVATCLEGSGGFLGARVNYDMP